MEQTVETGGRDIKCGRCGKEFGCGIGSESCWCLSFSIPSGVLASMRQSYADCICQNCITELTAKDKVASFEGGEND